MDEADRLRETVTRLAERVQELEADNRHMVNALVKALTLLDRATQPVIISGAPDPATPGFSFAEAFDSIRRAGQRMGKV